VKVKILERCQHRSAFIVPLLPPLSTKESRVAYSALDTR